MTISVAASQVITQIEILTEQYAPSALDRPNTWTNTEVSVLVVPSAASKETSELRFDTAEVVTGRDSIRFINTYSVTETQINVLSAPNNDNVITVEYSTTDIGSEYARHGVYSTYVFNPGEALVNVRDISADISYTAWNNQYPDIIINKDQARFVNPSVLYFSSPDSVRGVATVQVMDGELIPPDITQLFPPSVNIPVSYDPVWAQTANPQPSGYVPSAAVGTTTEYYRIIELTNNANIFGTTYPNGDYSWQDGPVSLVYDNIQFAVEPLHRPTSMTEGLEDSLIRQLGTNRPARTYLGTGYGFNTAESGVYGRAINGNNGGFPQEFGMGVKIPGAAMNRRYLRVSFDHMKTVNGSTTEGDYPFTFDAMIGMSTTFAGIPLPRFSDPTQSFPDLNHDGRAQLRRRVRDTGQVKRESSACLLSTGPQTSDIRAIEDSTAPFNNMSVFDEANVADMDDFFPPVTNSLISKTIYILDLQTGLHYFFSKNLLLKTTMDQICSADSGITNYDQTKDTYLSWGISPLVEEVEAMGQNCYVSYFKITVADTWDTVDILLDPEAEPTGSYQQILRSWENDEDENTNILSDDQQAGIETANSLILPPAPNVLYDVSKAPAPVFEPVIMLQPVKFEIKGPWLGDQLGVNKVKYDYLPKVIVPISIDFSYRANHIGEPASVDILALRPIIPTGESPELQNLRVAVSSREYFSPSPMHSRVLIETKVQPTYERSFTNNILPAQTEIQVENSSIYLGGVSGNDLINNNAVLLQGSTLITTGLDRYFYTIPTQFNSVNITILIENNDFSTLTLGQVDFSRTLITTGLDRVLYFSTYTQETAANAFVFTQELSNLVFFQGADGRTQFGIESDFVIFPVFGGGVGGTELLISE